MPIITSGPPPLVTHDQSLERSCVSCMMTLSPSPHGAQVLSSTWTDAGQGDIAPLAPPVTSLTWSTNQKSVFIVSTNQNLTWSACCQCKPDIVDS